MTTKRFNSLLMMAFITSITAFAQQAKYVFYFIGDGMGVNQVLGTEMYLSELKNEIGYTPLLFSTFPVASNAVTYSATNKVTDSAAAGTALATGKKTKNGTIGMLKDLETPVTSVAVWAKNNGTKVGISTSVSIDDATPAAFYAHQPNRYMRYEIGRDLTTSNFDFFAGSDFVSPNPKKDDTQTETQKKKVKNKKNKVDENNLYVMAQKANYTIARGFDDYNQKAAKAQKMILFQPAAASAIDASCIPYALDRKPGDMTLTEITRAGIDFLTKTNNDKGFFLMVEGGKIDWAGHSNDAAVNFREVIDMDSAVQVAYNFYKQHPDETLIVVTADHETGGLALGTGKYEMHLNVLSQQKMSEANFTKLLNGLRQKYDNNVPWDVVKDALKENFGFWNTVTLNEKQEQRLKDVYNSSFTGKAVEMKKTLYQQSEPLAWTARVILNEIAMVGWASYSHSAGCVPVFAIGAGSELFQGKMNNIEIPERIAKAAGYNH